jgi:hypothetical protein
MQDIGFASGLGLTWGFTGQLLLSLAIFAMGRVRVLLTQWNLGALLGVYATTNGGPGNFKTYVFDWNYVGQSQVLD